MLDTRIMEVQIAADDHRLLSANAEAWWLAQNDVFVPLESFLTEESRTEFLRRLDSGDTAWFLTCFSRTPETPYLTRVFPKAPDGGEVTMIRVVLCPLNSLMDDYRDAIGALSAYDAMLSLQDDLYFVYDPEEDTIRLHNGAAARPGSA